MTALGQALSDYLTLRRRLGYAPERDQPQLEQFVKFLEGAGAERITTELALRWARIPAQPAPDHLAPAALDGAPVRSLSGDG